MNPKARHRHLLVDNVGEETIVYDENRQEAHCLNRAASIVWQNSDGAHSVSQLAAVLATELGTDLNESVVEYALDELTRVHLLENGPDGEPVTRRSALRRVALAGAAAVALPIVLSVASPTPAMAASGSQQNNQGQNNNNQGQNQQ